MNIDTPKIYALFDPLEPLQVRYVGQTIKSLELRLRGHISGCKCEYYSRSAKNVWIRKLLSEGRAPAIKMLSESTIDHISSDERKWILFWLQYCDVLNVRDGGNQVPVKWKWSKRRKALAEAGHFTPYS